MKERIERFSRYMEYKGLNDNQVTIQCGLGVGVIGGAKKGKSDLGQKTIDKILEKYQDLHTSFYPYYSKRAVRNDRPF